MNVMNWLRRLRRNFNLIAAGMIFLGVMIIAPLPEIKAALVALIYGPLCGALIWLHFEEDC